MTDFQKGYKQAIDTFELSLNASIQRNNGARTAKEVLAVYNDMILFLNNESTRMNDVEMSDDTPISAPANNPIPHLEHELGKAEKKLKIIELLGGL